jgi:perosamine synthetase
MVNGTAALHIALKLAGVRANDEVLMSTLTFIAPANAVRYCGAWPVFVDASEDHWQIDPQQVRAFCEHECERRDGTLVNKATGRRIAALLPVHILGHPAPVHELRDIARQFGLPIIEDAAEAVGAQLERKPVGHGSAMACLSFNGNKIMTTGGGGMLVTTDPVIADRARYLTTQAKDDPIESIHGEIGHNYRMTNLAAALGVAQFEQLSDFVAARRRIAARYAEQLSDLPGVVMMPQAPWADSSCWLSTIRIDADAFGVTSRDVLARLGEAGIESRPLWQPLHRSPAMADAPRRDCPVADALYDSCLSLPSSASLSESGQQRVIDVIRNAAR